MGRDLKKKKDLSRLGVYQDGPFRVTSGDGAGPRIVADPADAPFFRFVSQVAGSFDEYVVFARVVGEVADPDERLLLPPHARLVELPDYGGLRHLAKVARAAFSTGSAFWRGLDRVDAVWTFGPQPFELVLVVLALARRKRVILGVRQDTPAYFRARIRGRSWKPVLAAIDLMDGLHRRLARRVCGDRGRPGERRPLRCAHPARARDGAVARAGRGRGRGAKGPGLERADRAADGRSRRRREEPGARGEAPGRARAPAPRPLPAALGRNRTARWTRCAAG